VKKHHTVGKITKHSFEKSQREAKSIPLTHIQDRSFSWLGIGTSIKSGGIKLEVICRTIPVLPGP
jgi:hypothetical protein